VIPKFGMKRVCQNRVMQNTFRYELKLEWENHMLLHSCFQNKEGKEAELSGSGVEDAYKMFVKHH
jgi:hypothetical protein